MEWLFTTSGEKTDLEQLLVKEFSSEKIQKMVSRPGSKGRLERLFPFIDKLLNKYRLIHDDIVALARKQGKKFTKKLAQYS